MQRWEAVMNPNRLETGSAGVRGLLTLVAGVTIYGVVALALHIGNLFANRVQSSWPLLVAIGMLMSLLGGLAWWGRRESVEQRAHAWSEVLRRLSRIAGPVLALGMIVQVFGIADWWQGDAGNFLS